MSSEYSAYCSELSALVQQYSDCYKGIQFHERDQAVEVFTMQSLAMASSGLRAAALLLNNDLVPEAILVTRSIQELLFNIRWIVSASDPLDRLERVYSLEAGPYSSWQKEVSILRSHAETTKDLEELARAIRFSQPLDDYAQKYSYLTTRNSDGTYTFKSPPPFVNRMTSILRVLYYHVYRFTSLFAHPTPMTKDHYLKASNTPESRYTAESEAIKQSLAYSFLFAQLTVGSAEEILASCSPNTSPARETIYRKIIDVVKRANKNYFSTP